MTTFAILATGPSMSQAVADSARSLRRIAVSDAWRLAPDADALVSTDAAWWRANREAMDFAGRKFSVGHVTGVERVEGMATSSNSGLLAMHVAVKLGATRILLLGFDMHGTHFFGPHMAPLVNTTPDRFEIFKRAFKRWAGCPVVNCTPNSALECFPRGTIDQYLQAEVAA